MQQIQIIGYLGKDAVIRSTNGNDILVFNVCCSESYKKQNGEEVDKNTWYSCTYRNTALAQYLKKGGQVMVQGELRAKTYQNDRRETLIDLSIQVSRIQLCGKPKS